MNNIFTYNEFVGSVNFAAEDEIFCGRIKGINDLVTFEGNSVSDLKIAFEESVDKYIELCHEVGKDAKRSFKGSFKVIVKPELHARAYQNALMQGKTLSLFIQEAIEMKLNAVH